MTRRYILTGAILFVVLIALAGCTGRRAETRRPPAPEAPAETPKPVSEARLSWDEFVAEAEKKCDEAQGCKIYHEAYKEYDGQAFGVMAIGYEDSEYFVDVYRYDPDKDEWEANPIAEPENGYPHTDVPAASETWGVPEDVIQSWIDEAERAVREKTSE